jgi:hypothetical protein
MRAKSKKEMREMVAHLKNDRPKIEAKMASKIGIIGSMLGMKVTDESATDELGMTFFVSDKVPNEYLSKKDRIPKTITIDGRVWTTDVMQYHKMEEHCSLPQSSIIYDGALHGTITCFAEFDGNLYGVSCAHCLVGPDRNPATPTEVHLYQSQKKSYLKVGMSSVAMFGPGFPIAGSSGFIDCGIFTLDSNLLLDRAKSSRPIRLVTDITSLMSETLSGRSALLPSMPTHRTATVIGINKNVLGNQSDIALLAEDPGFFKGDSGMLWVTKEGLAAGVHSRGEVKPGSEGSKFVAAMAAVRVAQILGVKLRVG